MSAQAWETVEVDGDVYISSSGKIWTLEDMQRCGIDPEDMFAKFPIKATVKKGDGFA